LIVTSGQAGTTTVVASVLVSYGQSVLKACVTELIDRADLA
jgi:hypothetical protein